MTYYEFVKAYMGVDESCSSQKYSSAGHTFSWNTDVMEGDYWFYQSDDFIIDVHDFLSKKNFCRTTFIRCQTMFLSIRRI